MALTAIIWWSFIIVLLLYVILQLKKIIVVNIYLHKLGGPPSNSLLFGNGVNFYTTPDNLFKISRQWSLSYYPVYKTWLFHIVAANIVNPEDMEIILSNPSHSKKSFVYKLLHGWLGTGLLTSAGQKWHTRRKVLTPAFHFNILRQFVPIFNEHSRCLVDNLKRECDQPYVKVNNFIKRFTLQSIAETTMGTSLEFKTKAEENYRKAVTKISDLFFYRIFRPWLHLNFIYGLTTTGREEKRIVRTLHKFTNDVVCERQKSFKLSHSPQGQDIYQSKERLAMLDLLLSTKINKGIIDDEGIREEVHTFMFEGHDTTAMAITYGLMELACNRHVQDKIVNEMVEILGDIKKLPTYDDLQAFSYMERSIKEIMRLYPSVPFLSRELGEDVVIASGYKLPKGSLINFHIFDLHRNPVIYPDPDNFDPDRFLPELCQKRHPFAYLPFSAGQRNCVGRKFAILEMKAVLCAILSHFILEPVDTPSSIVFLSDLILRTRDDIKVKFVPRL